MHLRQARITSFRSIEDSTPVRIEDTTTVLVGKNESGKTGFLHALYKARPVDEDEDYVLVDDYPRRGLTEYERRHATTPATVAVLHYELTRAEVEAINDSLDFELLESLSFSCEHTYANQYAVNLRVPEKPYIQALIAGANLPAEVRERAGTAEDLQGLIGTLGAMDLNSEASAFLAELRSKFGDTPQTWRPLAYWIWKYHISRALPVFLYFDEYYLLDGKVNLAALKQAVNTSRQNKQPLPENFRTVTALLRMAGVDIQKLTDADGYEETKARLEAISNSVTDQLFQYWTQNTDLDVEFDIRTDPKDVAPYNNGPNLYIRIRNRRHRMSVPFSQRSRGFIWFFSFLVWFESIQHQISEGRDLILLLDEPGLSLHAMAQADLLRYLDNLATRHQIVYTTHSPFMVPDSLARVRTVEDRVPGGTKITDNVSGSSSDTLFPLQAALGYTLAQNLFVGRSNLLVEGPADLLYLRFMSNLLEGKGLDCLAADTVVIPVGGLDKLATFVALLRGNDLSMVVLHDYAGAPDPRLESLVREHVVRDRQVLHYGMFSPNSAQPSPCDVEDLFGAEFYLRVFSLVFSQELGGRTLTLGDLPQGDRLIARIDRWLSVNAIVLRKSGGFNHYRVANYLVTHPDLGAHIPTSSLTAFSRLFSKVNSLLDSDARRGTRP